MGYSIAWVAVQTSARESLFELARVAPTDEADEFFESPISGVELDDGWFLLVGRGCDHRLIDGSLLASLSALGPCVAGSVEEHVMFSRTALWQNQTEVWSVSHDAQQGVFDLSTTGHVPASYLPLRERIFRDQEAEGGAEADVDFVFDIPLLLAKELCGFKHDETPPCGSGSTLVAFSDLASRRLRGNRPWWRFW